MPYELDPVSALAVSYERGTSVRVISLPAHFINHAFPPCLAVKLPSEKPIHAQFFFTCKVVENGFSDTNFVGAPMSKTWTWFYVSTKKIGPCVWCIACAETCKATR